LQYVAYEDRPFFGTLSRPVPLVSTSRRHGRKDRLVVQDPVRVLHPILAQAIDFLSDPMIAKLQLRASHINHGASSRVWAKPDPGAAVRD
jgi:hypothetical protein